MQLAFRLRSVNDFACVVKGKVHCLSQPLTAFEKQLQNKRKNSQSRFFRSCQKAKTNTNNRSFEI